MAKAKEGDRELLQELRGLLVRLQGESVDDPEEVLADLASKADEFVRLLDTAMLPRQEELIY